MKEDKYRSVGSLVLRVTVEGTMGVVWSIILQRGRVDGGSGEKSSRLKRRFLC